MTISLHKSKSVKRIASFIFISRHESVTVKLVQPKTSAFVIFLFEQKESFYFFIGDTCESHFLNPFLLFSRLCQLKSLHGIQDPALPAILLNLYFLKLGMVKLVRRYWGFHRWALKTVLSRQFWITPVHRTFCNTSTSYACKDKREIIRSNNPSRSVS